MDITFIKNKLDEYLEFDSSYLFNNLGYDLISIFGGSIRDIVSGNSNEINDIDMLITSKSIKHIVNVIEQNGYTLMDLVKPDIQSIYKDIKFVFYPLTFMNANKKIIQLIRPSGVFNKKVVPGTEDFTKLNYLMLLENVDLSSSGLFYDGYNLYESIEHSYLHCRLKKFEIIKDALMFDEIRTSNRISKLVYKKGWDMNIDDDILSNRYLKIHKLGKFDYLAKPISEYKHKIGMK